MKKNFGELPLRTGVGIVVLNNDNKVFVARRIDNAKNFWQMPQGGVDEGEDFLKAAFRELEEETSIKSVKLIKELDGTITYELPNHLLGIIWKGKYKGQKQKWFLMKFIEEELKKLSRSQGRILIKLVHRQTGTTTHDLVKELRNGWRAFIYQTTASLFDLTLKDTFDPKVNREDFMIEDILQRANSDNIIELDPTALTYNLDSLYQIWRTKKRYY